MKNCFAAGNKVTLDNGEIVDIMNLKVGNKVKTLGNEGEIVDSEVVAFIHKEMRKAGEFNAKIKFNLLLLNILKLFY